MKQNFELFTTIYRFLDQMYEVYFELKMHLSRIMILSTILSNQTMSSQEYSAYLHLYAVMTKPEVTGLVKNYCVKHTRYD